MWINLSNLSDKNILPAIQNPLLEYVKTGVFIPSFWAVFEHIEKELKKSPENALNDVLFINK